MMAPKARKYLSADALLGLLRTGFAAMTDHRSGKPDISLPNGCRPETDTSVIRG